MLRSERRKTFLVASLLFLVLWAEPTPGKLNLPPEGIHYVIVNGQVVVENGELTGTTPGRLVRRTWTIPGDSGEVISLYEGRF
jgi:hypothetical protein